MEILVLAALAAATIASFIKARGTRQAREHIARRLATYVGGAA